MLGGLKIACSIESLQGLVEVDILVTLSTCKISIILILYCQFMQFVLSYSLKFGELIVIDRFEIFFLYLIFCYVA